METIRILFESKQFEIHWLTKLLVSGVTMLVSWVSSGTRKLRQIVSALSWIGNPGLNREVSPNSRPQERHEFEVIELRRGGF